MINELDLDEKLDKASNDALTAKIKSEIESLAKAKGKSKETLLPTLSEETHKLLVLSLDPFQKFGVSTIYKKVEGEGLDWNRVFKLLSLGEGRTLKADVDKMTFDQMEIIDGVFKKWQRQKVGIGAKTYLKVFPGAFDYFELQTAHHMEGEKDFPGPGYCELKLDGIRCIAIVGHDGNVNYVSRNGLPVLNVSEDVTLSLQAYPGFCFDGEVRAKKNFQESLSTFKKKNTDVRMSLDIFDMITIEELQATTCELGYEDRIQRMRYTMSEEDFNDLVVGRMLVNTYAEAKAFYDNARAAGEEGALYKTANGKYSFKRTNDWLKMKPLEQGDFKIVGYEEGSVGSKYEGMLGAWIVVDEFGIRHRIGGGITDELRKKFWEERDDMIGAIIEVEFMERTEIKTDKHGKKTGGKLRHAVFLQVRWDKDEPNTVS
uniref:DNA ligase n=1 Tax=Ochrobactrum phage ORM_20 TaxID=2985243 RepID=A0A9N6WVE0_9VIRU|nr:ATP-dependent DNA ligase [Ochrobactrum phage ORM_20]